MMCVLIGFAGAVALILVAAAALWVALRWGYAGRDITDEELTKKEAAFFGHTSRPDSG